MSAAEYDQSFWKACMDGNYNNHKASRFFDAIMETYGRALSASGMNVVNPIETSITHYNKLGSQLTEPVNVGKSYVFITRPNLNLCRANIESDPRLTWIYGSRIGRMCMSFLTHPDSYIYHHDYDISSITKYSATVEKTMQTYRKAKEDALRTENATEDSLNKLKSTLTNIDTLSHNAEVSGSESANKTDGNVGAGKARSIPNYYDGSRWVEYNCGSAFIPLLCNRCVEVPGGKDYVLDTKTSDPNFRGANFVVPTGADEMRESGDLSLSFDDMMFSPVHKMIFTWVYYIIKQAMGDGIYARREDIVRRILNYTCSIFVFNTAADNSTIIGWARYGGCFPKGVPMNQILHSREPNTDGWNKLSIPFQYQYYSPMDPQDFVDFNILSEFEWLRKPKDPYKFSSTTAGKIKPTYLHKEAFEYIHENKYDNSAIGSSGRVPPQLIDTGDAYAEKSSQFGGYPYISNNRLVWLTEKDVHNIVSDGTGPFHEIDNGTGSNTHASEADIKKSVYANGYQVGQNSKTFYGD